MNLTRQLCSWDYAPHPTHNLWTTGNVNEVLPGVIRPLSADVIGLYMHLYARGIIDSIEAGDRVEVASPPAANVFGFFGGRWAVNVAWLTAYFVVFSPDQQSEILEQFMSGDNPRSEKYGDRERALRAQTAQQQLWAQSLDDARAEQATATNWQREMLARDLVPLSDADLVEMIDQTIRLCADLFVTHSFTTTAGGAHNALLKAFLDEKLPDHDPAWQTTLTSALGNVISAEPVSAIWELSRHIAASRELARDFASDDPPTLKSKLSAPPNDAWRGLAGKLTAFNASYGFRGQNEVDPAIADWGEDPSFVLSALRADVAAPSERDPAAAARRAEQARSRLEGEIDGRLSLDDRARFHELLGPTQEYVRARELSKANWARASRAFRPPLLELGGRMQRLGLIAERDDIFFLRWSEVQAATRDALPADEAQHSIAARKAEYQRLHDFRLPEMFSLPVELLPQPSAEAAVSVLKGLGVSSGTVSGRSRIVRSAEATDDAMLEPGEILVAPFTDAPWTPLFWPAAAVITETGGMLSHAATVAREYGIPAVVNVAGATRLIENGAMLTVDGTSGTIEIAG